MAFERGGRVYRGARPGQEMWNQNFVPIQQEQFMPPLRGRDCGFWPQNVGYHYESTNQNGFMPGVVPGMNNVNYGRPRPDFAPPMYDAKQPMNKTMPAVRTQTMRSLNGDIFVFPTAAGEPTTVSGIGELTWLSSKAGLITCKRTQKTVSFQTKDFCDQLVNDLTDVLCVGFTLCYQATMSEASDGLIATNVMPLQGAEAEKEFFASEEVDLEAAQARATSGPPRSPKDMYSVALEKKAIPVILSVFKNSGGPCCQLSSLHSHICNNEDRELNRYIGTSSLKRRQFIEKRTHLFDDIQGDQVRLQPPVVYQTINRLAHYLLCRGGVTSTKSLYDFYIACPELAEGRQCFEESHPAFVRLLNTHNWIFSLFPSQIYVSVRRNLPPFDYADFVKKYIPNCYPPDRRSVAPSPMVNPSAPSPLLNQLPAGPVVAPIARPGSNMGADGCYISRTFSVPQTTVSNMQPMSMTYSQFPAKRSTSVSNPPNGAVWNEIVGVPPVNSLTDIPTVNGYNHAPYTNGMISEATAVPPWSQARSYSSSSSPALSAMSYQIEGNRKLVDSATQTEKQTNDWKISDEVLRELCPGCAKRIASIWAPQSDFTGLFNGLSLSHSPNEGSRISPTRFGSISNTAFPCAVHEPVSPPASGMPNDSVSQKSSSSSSTSVISPAEDICSLSSGTPTTVEGLLGQEGREYDPFKTLIFLESGPGLQNSIF